MLTCAPNATVAPLHNRMPVILAPDCYNAWLDTKNVSAEEALAMTGPAPDGLLEAIPLSGKVCAKPKAGQENAQDQNEKQDRKDEDDTNKPPQPPLP